MRLIDGWWVPDICSGPGKYIRRSAVIDYALGFWHGPRRCVVQASAHVGTFARRLVQHFEQVVCVEPAPENWECLVLNTQHTPRIARYYGILGAMKGVAAVNIQPHGSAGHHVMTREDRPHVAVTVHTIDTLGYDDVDALFLDLEGFELLALQGAMQTLGKYHPLIVAEDNGCSQKYGILLGAIGAWLGKECGYRLVGTHCEDSIFVPGES